MEEKSKSQRKREVKALQATAVAMSQLPDRQLKKIPLPDHLYQALLDYKKLKSHGAMHRQAQYLGRLMREIDTAPIIEAFNAL